METVSQRELFSHHISHLIEKQTCVRKYHRNDRTQTRIGSIYLACGKALPPLSTRTAMQALSMHVLLLTGIKVNCQAQRLPFFDEMLTLKDIAS